MRSDAGQQHDDPPMLQPRDRVIEHECTGRVDRADPAHPEDDHRDIRDLGELEQEAVSRPEKEWPVEAEGILGQVQAFGQETGVPTPTIDVVCALLRCLDLSIREARPS